MKKKPLDASVIRQAAAILKAIGHPVRLRIIECLEQYPGSSVSALLEKIRLPQAELSKHLAFLRSHGILKSETRGNFRIYSIAYPGVVHVLDCIRNHHKA